LHNRSAFAIKRLFVVDRRTEGTVRFAVVDGSKEPFNPGATRRIELSPVGAADWPAAGARQVQRALLDAGLFEPEARALLAIWEKRLLEGNGIMVYHILPTSEYDRMLPLDILPAPAAKPVRVGIAVHPHMEIEPVQNARIAVLIRQLDDPKFTTRDAASKTLTEIGPLASAMLREELKKGPSLELRRRIETVLEAAEAPRWLEAPK
jgi:hypothetical protein